MPARMLTVHVLAAEQPGIACQGCHLALLATLLSGGRPSCTAR